MIRKLALLPVLALTAACGGAASDETALHAEIVDTLPPLPPYTAAGVFGCSGSGADTECRSCQLVAFGPGNGDDRVDADIYLYEFRPSDDGETLQISSWGPGGERREFAHDGTLTGARAAIGEARGWCDGQGARDWYVDRDELDDSFEGAAQ